LNRIKTQRRSSSLEISDKLAKCWEMNSSCFQKVQSFWLSKRDEAAIFWEIHESTSHAESLWQ
jgi:hypothetical protein